jgi:TolB-like protein/Tfp pilus assembly protein PilF
VLPLENLSRDPDQEYFADGLAEALITNLAKISALRVISRTTSMQYKGVRTKSVPTIAQELGVDGIVEGTVLRSGERVRISAQLVNASTDAHVWAESYERDLRDILGLQSELAQAIAREVQIKLTPQEKAHFQKVKPVDPEAYENYLRGRYYFRKRGGDMLQKGIQAFQQAITKDPKYVAAYAGLADCLSLVGWFAFVSPEEGCGKAKRLALRALEMDPGLAEAHSSLAWAIQHYDYDFLGAEKEYRRSIELDPRYEPAHYWFGIHLAAMGRFEEAIAEAKYAVSLDPLSRAANTNLAYVYWCARRYDQLIDQSKKTLELHPDLAHLHWALGFGYLENSQYEAAIAELQAAVEHSRGAPIFLALLGETYAIAGRGDEAQRSLDKLNELSNQRYITPYMLGRIYAALNEKDEALSCFELAYHGRAAWTVYLKVDPHLDQLRSEPRLQDLMRCMNFPP